MKRFISVLSVLVLSLGLLTGCGQSGFSADIDTVHAAAPEETQEDTADKQAKTEKEVSSFPIEAEGIDYLLAEGMQVPAGSVIAMVGKDADSAYWNRIRKGAEAAVAELNSLLGYSGNDKIKLLYDAPTDGDVAEQIDIIDQMLDKNPDVLCVGFIDVNSGSTQMELAQSNGIPVLSVDSGIDHELLVSRCGTDNYKAGAEAARELSKAMGDSGKIGLLVHSQLTETGIERQKGFEDEIRANHPQIELVHTAYMQQDERSTEEIVEEALGRNPDLKAYFGTNGEAVKELVKALKPYQTEERPILVAGFDFDETQRKELEEGQLAGVVVQNPYGMGYAAVIAAGRAVLGLENAEVIDTGYCWVTKEALGDARLQALSYK